MARFAVHIDPGRSDHEGLTRLFGKVLTGSGVVETDDLEVTAQASPDMTVEVAGGDIAIYDDDTLYHGWATTSETVVIPANNSGVIKTDAVVAYIDLTAGSSTSNNPDALAYEVVRRSGTDTGAPTAGEIEAEVGEVYHLLALVEVGNGVSSINSGNITDQREQIFLSVDRMELVDRDNLEQGAATFIPEPYEVFNDANWNSTNAVIQITPAQAANYKYMTLQVSPRRSSDHCVIRAHTTTDGTGSHVQEFQAAKGVWTGSTMYPRPEGYVTVVLPTSVRSLRINALGGSGVNDSNPRNVVIMAYHR